MSYLHESERLHALLPRPLCDAAAVFRPHFKITPADYNRKWNWPPSRAACLLLEYSTECAGWSLLSRPVSPVISSPYRLAIVVFSFASQLNSVVVKFSLLTRRVISLSACCMPPGDQLSSAAKMTHTPSTKHKIIIGTLVSSPPVKWHPPPPGGNFPSAQVVATVDPLSFGPN